MSATPTRLPVQRPIDLPRLTKPDGALPHGTWAHAVRNAIAFASETHARFAQVGAAIVIVIGSTALLGWFTGTRVLTAVSPAYIPVAPNTALVFVLLGIGLWVLGTGSTEGKRLAQSLAAVSLTIAGTRLAEYVVGIELGVDHWLFSVPSETLGLAPVGRMAFFTALAFVFGSGAVLAIGRRHGGGFPDDLARALGILTTLVGLVFLLGYAYGSPLLYGGRSIPMALPTAAAFTVLGLAITVPLVIRAATERRHTERLLRLARDELERRVAERTAELEQANEALQSTVVDLEEQTEESEALTEQLEASNQELQQSLTNTARAEAALAVERRFLRQVIDTIPHFVFAKDRAGRFTLVNDAVAKAYGTTPDALMRKTVADLDPNAREAEAFRRDDLRVIDSGESKVIPEEEITDATGAVRYLHTIKRPLIGEDGRADQVLSVSTDITERKRVEMQLIQAQKMEAVGQLAGGVAHDFNNMLTAIKSFAELLAADGRLTEQQLRDLGEITKAADRAATLTRQLLAFSRKQVMQPRVVDLNAVVTDVEAMLRRLMVGDVALVTKLAPDLDLVEVDPGQMEQVLMNLAVNARDAMPGGGRLTIATANVELDDAYCEHHPTAKPGAHVMLSVSDTGHGMDEATRRRIFEPFFTTKERGKGTGLGLSTVYGIVKQSGGHIWVYSEVGQGTVFKLYFPRAAGTAATIARPVLSGAPPAGSGTILLVDDEEALRKPMRRALEKSGYTVIEAASGEEALVVCAEHEGPIHLIITDMMMPGMHGREMMERIARDRSDARVLFTSGYADEQIIGRGLLDPTMAFLQKPFALSELLTKVRSLFESQPST